MDALRSYLLSVTAAALLCSIAHRFLGNKGVGNGARFLTSVFLVLTVLQPLGKKDLLFLDQFRLELSSASDAAIAEGKDNSQKAMAQIIKKEAAAYILEKAKELHLSVQVTVEVSDDPLPVPIGVKISGQTTPYSKIQLQNMIEQQLGIPKENQRWT